MGMQGLKQKDSSASGRGNSKRTQSEAPRGLVQGGRYFEFNPSPPEQDLLGNPLTVPDMPVRALPIHGWRARLSQFLAKRGIGRRVEERRLRWKAYEMAESLRLSVSPAVTAMIEGTAVRPRFPGQNEPLPLMEIFHPYQLNYVIDFLLQLDEAGLIHERKYLELLLAKILQQYGETMVLISNKAFSFEHEARDYFYTAVRQESLLPRVTHADEIFASIQSIYNNYFHGSRYYVLALFRREKMAEENKLFFFYCRAIFFMARITWDGTILDKPPVRQLPQRDDLMFLARRDQTVMARYQAIPEFKAQVNGILTHFPS